MAIHHTQLKQAEKNGFTLEEIPAGGIRAFWPEQAVEVRAYNGGEAVRQMLAAQAIAIGGDYRISEGGVKIHVVRIDTGEQLASGPMTPVEAYEAISGGSAEWEEIDESLSNMITEIPPEDTPVEIKLVQRSDKGIPLDGGIAHAEGFTASDCPWTSETDDEEEYAMFERWNQEFDDHADAAEEEEPSGSVVKQEYRARYAEAGHPTTCGDDLAVILNNLCQTEKNGTDLSRFEAICAANGVDLSKYNRTNNGWQGRLRMTGRNMLARRVFAAGGVLKTPVDGAEPEYRMSGEWMATRKFVKQA